MKQFRFLLVNPPIYDFAAFDLWAKPLGLLYLASLLNKFGHRVRLVDALDRLHPRSFAGSSNQWGCGQYHARYVARPNMLKDVPRRYKRYGMPHEHFEYELAAGETPDFVLITSGMTYWYLGVQEAVSLVKKLFPVTPVILGGTYATLCPDHARAHSGADFIVEGGIENLVPVLDSLGCRGMHIPSRFSDFPPPAYEFYPRLEYAAVRISKGCPFRCTYCAVEKLGGAWEQKLPERVAAEIIHLAERGMRNIAFYDDALLHNAEDHISPVLSAFKRKGIAFHSPNGLHARFITASLARLMKESGFVLPRISLEARNPEFQKKSGGKITTGEFESAVNALLEVGFRRGEYIAYLLLGCAGQDLAETEAAIRYAHEKGALVSLAEYSPIPGTADWEKARHALPSDDPLYHNNSLFPLFSRTDQTKIQRLKDLARQLNRSLKSQCST